MANLSDFLPAAGGGGGGIPKYQEFTTSGTFTPSQALIDAGGRVAYIIVGGGSRGSNWGRGGAGGEVRHGYETLTSTSACTITIGSGATSNSSNGGDTTAAFSSAGGNDIISYGGRIGNDATGSSASSGAASDYDGGPPGPGVFGFGGGAGGNADDVINRPRSHNYGQAGGYNAAAGIGGYVRITWFE